MQDSSIQLFEYKGASVRTISLNGEVWFIAKDVCNILEIANTSDALRELDDDEKNTIVISDGNRGNPNKNIMSESGLYKLMFKSRKSEAKEFTRWVTHEVLPQVMRDGKYEARSYALNTGNSENISITSVLSQKKAQLQTRKDYWYDLLALIEPLLGKLSKSAYGYFKMSEYVNDNSSDQRDIDFLCSVLLASRKLMLEKIQDIESSEDILDMTASL